MVTTLAANLGSTAFSFVFLFVGNTWDSAFDDHIPGGEYGFHISLPLQFSLFKKKFPSCSFNFFFFVTMIKNVCLLDIKY